METIRDIKKMLDSTEIEKLPEVLKSLKSSDKRQGVKSLVLTYEKKCAKYLAERQRLSKLLLFENECYDKGFNIIAGTDEVGRGPLAGPVVAAMVILPKGFVLEGINDSKKLSHKKREELSVIIKEKALDFAFGVVSPETIDEINILQATYEAMRKAYNELKLRPDFILADAVRIPGIEIPQRGIIKGDEKSVSIAAASIIAKVFRDSMMESYDEAYPGYGFAQNKGYGSADHISAIKTLKPSPIHRRSFIKNFI